LYFVPDDGGRRGHLKKLTDGADWIFKKKCF